VKRLEGRLLQGPGQGELVALLDLGSNASRFLVARVAPGVGFEVLRKERVQTRLGEGPAGRLRRAAIEATLDAVHRFLGRVSHDDESPRVVAVATAAVRDAVNRESLLTPLREREGVVVRVLTGLEEARLGAEAALRSFPIRDGIVADLGGSSLQVTQVRAGQIRRAASLPLGAIRLTQGFLASDPPTLRESGALREEVRRRLRPVLPVTGPTDRLVVLGGTVRSLARIYLAAESDDRSRHGLRLQLSDVAAIRKRLERMPADLRRRVRGLKSERADTIVAGVLVVEEVMSLLGQKAALTVCTSGVRDGLLWNEVFREEAGAVHARAHRHALGSPRVARPLFL
jgi:exopolyphosphatase/guanosine-5'-triphosphate,3'-diphosphate pyrophosphatase